MTKKPMLLLAGTALTAVAIAGIGKMGAENGSLPDASRKAEFSETGRIVYAEYCASCHGENLEGEPNWRQRRPDGYLPAPPHDDSGHTWHHPDRQLFAITKFGTAAFAPAGYKTAMTGFGDRLSDCEIRAVLAFIGRHWGEKERAYQAAATQRASQAQFFEGERRDRNR